MRIVHFADLHLGVENYGRIDPQTGLSTRLGDFLSAFDEVVDYALKENVDLVLFCGDAYKSREPSQTHQREFAKRIWRLASNDVPVFLLIGNHDLPNAIGRATSIPDPGHTEGHRRQPPRHLSHRDQGGPAAGSGPAVGAAQRPAQPG